MIKAFRIILSILIIGLPIIYAAVHFSQVGFIESIKAILPTLIFVLITIYTLISGLILFQFKFKRTSVYLAQIALLAQVISISYNGFIYSYQVFPFFGITLVQDVLMSFKFHWYYLLNFKFGFIDDKNTLELSINFIPLALLIFVDRLKKV